MATLKMELSKYNAAVQAIRPLHERQVPSRAGKLVDTFSLKDWWRAAASELPGFFKVLRAVLTHAPNSCPPERVWSILGDTFEADQANARADYIEHSLHNQRPRD